MANMDPVLDFLNGQMGEAAETPAGEGWVAGCVDRNGEMVLLVDLGERLQGNIPVVQAFAVVHDERGLRVGAMARAAAVAAGREGALE